MNPEKFQNKTNGITPRRWLLLCNPSLADLIAEKIGEEWPVHLEQLQRLKEFAKDSSFQTSIRQIKQVNKLKLATLIEKEYGLKVNPASMFDIQVCDFFNVMKFFYYQKYHFFTIIWLILLIGYRYYFISIASPQLVYHRIVEYIIVDIEIS